MRKSTQILKEVDPNLNVVSAGGRHQRRTTQTDWDKLDGTKCPTCNRDVLRVYGPFGQCYRCFRKEKCTSLEEVGCPKCTTRAVKVTTLVDGLQVVKIICASCGTYQA